MAKPNVNTVNFLSYNSTGLDSVKTKWIRDLLDTCQVNFCGLQEHFKRIKTLSRLFRTEFSKYDSKDGETVHNSVINLRLKILQNTLVPAINGRGRERRYPVCQDGSVAALQQHAQLSP